MNNSHTLGQNLRYPGSIFFYILTFSDFLSWAPEAKKEYSIPKSTCLVPMLVKKFYIKDLT